VTFLLLGAFAAISLQGIGRAQPVSLLIATRSSQLIQNKKANADDLSRMQNVAMIQRFRKGGYLVRVPRTSRHYYVRYVPAKYRYLRPWSKLFLDRLSRQYYARFKKKLRVTSLVRTVALQKKLARSNGNAASATGPRRSSHLTGATLDISKARMTAKERRWMRRVLHSLRKKGYVYAVEEFRQPTFHIMVHKSYLEYVERMKGSDLKLASNRMGRG
jgi:hypothetical protein